MDERPVKMAVVENRQGQRIHDGANNGTNGTFWETNWRISVTAMQPATTEGTMPTRRRRKKESERRVFGSLALSLNKRVPLLGSSLLSCCFPGTVHNPVCREVLPVAPPGGAAATTFRGRCNQNIPTTHACAEWTQVPLPARPPYCRPPSRPPRPAVSAAPPAYLCSQPRVLSFHTEIYKTIMGAGGGGEARHIFQVF